jgi:peptide/nickel transport system permease protein
LGTDHVGRDTFQQIVHGSRDVLLAAFFAGIFTTAIAILVGMLAGLHGGMIDAILMLLTNVILTVPSLPIMMIIAAVWKVEDPVRLGLLLSIWTWGGLARGIRSQILSLKEREFIEAARALGLPTFYIVFRELLPNVMPFVAINFFSIMRGAITASVGLMFLGLIPFKATNWGMMLNFAAWQAGAIYVPKALFYFGSPMACIILFQLGAFFFASGLDEVLNPRLRT